MVAGNTVTYEIDNHSQFQYMKVILLGNPNVGKSALFNQLTKRYASVSNYPGTTVSISRGEVAIRDAKYQVLDTPGLYSLLPITDDERVARNILFDNEDSIIVHVVDSKNIDRMLGLTFQLQEMGLKLILDLNISDEAEQMGMTIDEGALEADLQIPVIKTVSTSGKGLDHLKEKIYELANA